MQWLTEDIIKEGRMVEEEVFIKEGQSVDVIADVIRLRGGIQRIPYTNATLMSGATRSGKRFRADTGIEVEIGTSRFRMRRTVIINDEDDPVAASAPLEVVRHIKSKNMLYTAYSYNMNPLMFCAVTGADCSQPGIGPALYWTTVETLTTGGVPNTLMGTLRYVGDPVNNGTVTNAFTQNGVMYVFAADWFGAEFQTDPRYQINQGPSNISLLGWAPAKTDVTTDPNTPITYQDLATNKDWSRIRHFCTYITFDFTNLAPYPYIVEILFFKFLVDPNDLTYQEQCMAPFSMQRQQVQAYCEGSIQSFGTPQIRVIRRKRIMIHGLETQNVISQNAYGVMNYCAVPTQRGNTAKYKFKIYRQYDVCRGIHAQPQSLNETTFFNYFYDSMQGIHCRVQAWPRNPFFAGKSIAATTNAPYPQLINIYDSACVPDATVNVAVLKPALQCILEKRSYIKVDSPILKGPLRTNS